MRTSQPLLLPSLDPADAGFFPASLRVFRQLVCATVVVVVAAVVVVVVVVRRSLHPRHTGVFPTPLCLVLVSFHPAHPRLLPPPLGVATVSARLSLVVPRSFIVALLYPRQPGLLPSSPGILQSPGHLLF